MLIDLILAATTPWSLREEGSGILVQGVLHRPEEKQRIQEAACAHAGEHLVRFDLRYR